MGTTAAIDWRERILAVLAGQVPDRMPAIFRLSRWYKPRVAAGTLPDEVAGRTLAEIEDHLGLARSARYAKVYHVVFRPPVECIVSRDGDRVITEYRTPRGTLRRVARFGPGDEVAGLDPAFVEFPIKTWDDYAACAEVLRHMEFVPAYDEYRRYDARIGRAGLPMVVIGAIPFHYLLQEWTGYEKGYLDLFDREDLILETVDAGNQAYRRMWDVVAHSPARLVMHGVNFDSKTTPPPMFRKYWMPYLEPFIALMHQAGKYVACHADGNMSKLLDETLQAGFDVADCFASAPLVPCTVAQARAAWKDRITIWGGLPSSYLEPGCPLDDLRTYLDGLLAQVAPGDRFMLGISDMALPTTSWEHLKVVGRWMSEDKAR